MRGTGDAFPWRMSSLKSVGAVLVLVVTFLILFTVAGQLLLPVELLDRAVTHPSSVAQTAGGLLVMASIDTAFILGMVLSSRLTGARLWLLTSAVYFAAKTFTAQLEAWYLMPSVGTSLVPAVMLMMLPVAVVVPLLTVVFYGRWDAPRELHPWRVPHMGVGQQLWKWLLLSALVAPALFFFAGSAAASMNQEVRAFYGDGAGTGSLPLLLEAARGVLGVALAVALLWSTGDRKWVGGLLVLLLLTLVQSDVHLVPNPLLPPMVQRFHFLEVVSANVVFALLCVWLMGRAHFISDKTDHHGPATPRLTGAS